MYIPDQHVPRVNTTSSRCKDASHTLHGASNKQKKLTIDISALAKNFCTAFFLSSLSAGSIVTLLLAALAAATATLAGMTAWRKDMGGDAEDDDVAEDDGVAIGRVCVEVGGFVADDGGVVSRCWQR
jgi:hypothetical protein